MITLDNVIESWKKDSNIEIGELDEASKRFSKCHAKYLELYSIIKLKRKKSELNQKILLRDKWLHFNGKLPKEKIDEYGWSYDPFDGLKIMKGDFHYFFEADEDLQDSEKKIAYLKNLEDTLKEIIENIKWKSQTIRNMLDFQKFSAGV